MNCTGKINIIQSRLLRAGPATELTKVLVIFMVIMVLGSPQPYFGKQSYRKTFFKRCQK